MEKKGKIKNQNEKYEKKIIATTMDGEKWSIYKKRIKFWSKEKFVVVSFEIHR